MSPLLPSEESFQSMGQVQRKAPLKILGNPYSVHLPQETKSAMLTMGLRQFMSVTCMGNGCTEVAAQIAQQAANSHEFYSSTILMSRS
jgi:hypothetical protein